MLLSVRASLIACFALAAALAAGPVAAGKGDDAKWIAQCEKDNKSEGAKPEVIKKYCTCMNDKMDDNETMSISQWEKKNPKTMEACSKQAGWK